MQVFIFPFGKFIFLFPLHLSKRFVSLSHTKNENKMSNAISTPAKITINIEWEENGFSQCRGFLIHADGDIDQDHCVIIERDFSDYAYDDAAWDQGKSYGFKHWNVSFDGKYKHLKDIVVEANYEEIEVAQKEATEAIAAEITKYIVVQ